MSIAKPSCYRGSLGHATLAAAACLSVSGCLSGPGFLKQSSASLSTAASQVKAPVLADQGGVVTAQLGSGSTETQEITASSGSGIAGTTLSFPPGSVAVATNVTLQTGATLASSGFAAQVGLAQGQTLTPAASTVVVQSSTPTDTAQPFTVAIQLGNAHLALDAGTSYAVIYNMYIASEGVFHKGIFPASAVTVVGNTATFQVSHFGAFQLVTTAAPVLVQQDVTTTTPIVTQAQAAAAPFELDGYTPYVVNSGKTVVLTGKNFRPTMVIALGGKPVKGLTVASDAAASFTMPSDTPYGFTDLAVQQDDSQETHKLFAMADKADLPLITVAPAGICAGVNYYDANGAKQTGTMVCNAPAATAATVAAPTPAPLPPDVMKTEVYDPAGAGVVSRANLANSAAQAGFAFGTQGTNFTIPGTGFTGTVDVPTNGTYFQLSNAGSADATVYKLTPMEAGTRITMSIVAGGSGNIAFMNNPNTSPKLVMTRPLSYYGPGDALEFIALTNNGDWQLLHEVINHVDATLTASNVTYSTGPVVWPTGSLAGNGNLTETGGSPNIVATQASVFQVGGSLTVNATSGTFSGCPPLNLSFGVVPPTTMTPVMCTYNLNGTLSLPAGGSFVFAGLPYSSTQNVSATVSFRRVQ